MDLFSYLMLTFSINTCTIVNSRVSFNIIVIDQ